MKYRVSIGSDKAEAYISDQLSFADHATFHTAIKELVAAAKKLCVIDLSNLKSVDSAGLGMFMIAHEECQKAKSSLILRGAQGQVQRMLDLARFDTILKIVPAE
jgi:anti-anti-sigma factor